MSSSKKEMIFWKNILLVLMCYIKSHPFLCTLFHKLNDGFIYHPENIYSQSLPLLSVSQIRNYHLFLIFLLIFCLPAILPLPQQSVTILPTNKAEDLGNIWSVSFLDSAIQTYFQIKVSPKALLHSAKMYTKGCFLHRGSHTSSTK